MSVIYKKTQIQIHQILLGMAYCTKKLYMI